MGTTSTNKVITGLLASYPPESRRLVLATRTFKNDETGSPGPLGRGLAEGFGVAGAGRVSSRGAADGCPQEPVERRLSYAGLNQAARRSDSAAPCPPTRRSVASGAWWTRASIGSERTASTTYASPALRRQPLRARRTRGDWRYQTPRSSWMPSCRQPMTRAPSDSPSPEDRRVPPDRAGTPGKTSGPSWSSHVIRSAAARLPAPGRTLRR